MALDCSIAYLYTVDVYVVSGGFKVKNCHGSGGFDSLQSTRDLQMDTLVLYSGEITEKVKL